MAGVLKRQKAAALLMSLDKQTAAELLRNVKREVVQGIALELVKLEQAGGPNGSGLAAMKEFSEVLTMGGREGGTGKGFLRDVLPEALGSQQAGEVMGHLEMVSQQADPFLSIRSMGVEELSRTLSEERALVIACVVLELASGKAAALLLTLSPERKIEVVQRMTSMERPSAATRQRIAGMIQRKLAVREEKAEEAVEGNRWRTVAVVLRSMESDVRKELLDTLAGANADAVARLREQMVLWEDLVLVEDRCLQQALHSVGIGSLARAMHGEGEEQCGKILSNISQRVRAMLKEEAELMGRVTQKEVTEAREEIVAVLREQDAGGELYFVEH